MNFSVIRCFKCYLFKLYLILNSGDKVCYWKDWKMDKDLLYKHLDSYIIKDNLGDDLKERLEREQYYKSYTSERILLIS